MELRNEVAEALYQEGRRAHDRSDYRAVRRIGSELFEMSKAAGDTLGMARGHTLLGNAFLHATADGESAERYYRSALDYYKLAGDRRGEAVIAMNLGSLALDINLDLTTARRLYEESLQTFIELGEQRLIAFGRSNLAEICRLEGDYDEAFAQGQVSLEIFRAERDSSSIGWQLTMVAHYHLLRREFEAAIATQREAYDYLCEEPNPELFAHYFEIWFYLTCDLHAHALASRILGFLDDYREGNHIPRLALMMPWYTPRVEKLQNAISYAEFLQYRIEGEAMTLEQAEQTTYSLAPPPR